MLSVPAAAATTTNPETVQDIRCDLISTANDSDWLVEGVCTGVNDSAVVVGFFFFFFFLYFS